MLFEQPVFIDEIQYAPSLFPYIKTYIDRTGAKGAFAFWFTLTVKERGDNKY